MNCTWNNSSTLDKYNTLVGGFDVVYTEMNITALTQAWLNYGNSSRNIGIPCYGFKMVADSAPYAAIVANSERAGSNKPYFEITYSLSSNYTLDYAPYKYNNITSNLGNISNFQNRMNCYAYALQTYYNGDNMYYLYPGEFGIGQNIENDGYTFSGYNENNERIIAMTAYYLYYGRFNGSLSMHYYLRNGNGTCPTHGGNCSIWSQKMGNGKDRVQCERARRILAHDKNIGERITLEQLEGAYGIWDNYSIYKEGWQTYIHYVPDIVHLDNLKYGHVENEYWLDDDGNTYVMFNEKLDNDDIKSFNVYDHNGNVIQNIPAVEMDSPYKDFRHDAEYREKCGFIKRNDGYYYIKPDNTAVFAWSDYTASDSIEPIAEPFIIENEINGCPVTAIETRAFSNAPLTEIILPDSIEFIDKLAFSTCRNLKKINFPENLKYLGTRAFVGCSSLNDIEIDCPKLEILRDTFCDCSALTSAKLNVKAIGESAFDSCSKLKNISFGESVTRLGESAFKNCEKLETIVLQKETKSIGQAAFLYSNVKAIVIPPTVKAIETLPMKKPMEYLSIGIIENFPLTDKPVCTFNSDCIIYGYKDTEAERYANEWNLEFVTLESVTGDLNFDGEFNISDVVTLQKYLVKKEGFTNEQWKLADLNNDGTVNVFDVIILKRRILKV